MLYLNTIQVFRFLYSVFQMYRKAIKEVDLTEKVSQITEKENYTKLSEMPKIYF